MAGQSWQEEQEAAAYIACSQEAQGMDVGAQPTSSVLFSLGLQLLEGCGLPAQLKLSTKTVLAMPRHPLA